MAYYFRLPSLMQLTPSQRAAVNETEQIALSGGPGTGKSVVSIYRHITNHGNRQHSLLITYTTTLARYLSESCRLNNISAANSVRSAYAGCPKKHEKFSEVIVDEAQDLGSNYYDSIDGFKVSYGADDSQILYPEHSSNKAELEGRYPDNVEYVLDQNFRSTYAIMNFAKVAFSNAYIPLSTLDRLRKNPGSKPTLITTNGNPRYDRSADSKRNDSIKDIIDEFRSNEHNIAILVPFKSTVKEYGSILDNLDIEHSIYYEDRDIFPDGCPAIDNVHVTTYKSAKGMEFDTVIIPDFGSKDYLCNSFATVKWNDFYVAVTRARSNLYLFSNYDIPGLSSVVDR